MERFIAEQNIRHYVSILETEADHGKRQTVGSLLIDQEDRFSSRSERLEQTSAFVAELEERIERQRDIIARWAGQPERAELSKQRLSNMLDAVALLKEYRQHVLDGIERDARRDEGRVGRFTGEGPARSDKELSQDFGMQAGALIASVRHNIALLGPICSDGSGQIVRELEECLAGIEENLLTFSQTR